MLGFSTGQVATLTGLSTRQLGYMDMAGVLGPEVRGAGGKGSRRLYSFRDVVALRSIAKLREGGVSLQAVRRAVKYIRELDQIHPSAVVLAVQGDDVTLVGKNQTVTSLIKQPGQLMFVLDISAVVKEVEAALRRAI